MKTPDAILCLLYDREGDYILLDDLAQRAGAAASTLEKNLQALQERGQVLEFSPARGVRLAWPPRLDAMLIERDLDTRRVGRNVIVFPEVDSTNDVAFSSARQAGADGLAVLAESQRRGRGRVGRTWISPPASNVLLSVLLAQDTEETLAHEPLTIAAGVALAQAIGDACNLECHLKWPNDVLLDGGKVAGILVEVRRQGGRRFVVIGAGVNANASPARSAVDAPATDLARHTGQTVDRIALVRAILRRLDQWVHTIRQGGIDELHRAWLSRCAMINQRVHIRCGAREHVGRILDVSPLEGLILCDDNGRTHHLPAENSSIVK